MDLNATEKWQNFCIYNNASGLITDTGYCPLSDIGDNHPSESGLALLKTDFDIRPSTHWIENESPVERVIFDPDWDGSTLLNAPINADIIVFAPSGKCVVTETLAGVVHFDCVDDGSHRVHIKAWPYLEWIGDIEPSETPDDTDHVIEIIAHEAITDAIDAGINQVKAAARRAQSRIYTNGKDARYKEKYSEVLRWRASGNPAPLMTDYPYAAGFAVAQDITLTASLELIEAKAAETITNGAAIENYEDSAKAEIQAATTFKQIHAERDFYIAMLDQL